jgi:hypothetical protein
MCCFADVREVSFLAVRSALCVDLKYEKLCPAEWSLGAMWLSERGEMPLWIGKITWNKAVGSVQAGLCFMHD